MSQHSLVSALLPAEYREQVLGDLHERGFLFRDIVNVVPRLWANQIVRSLTGPAPRVALGNAEAVIVRTQQLADQARTASVIAVGAAVTARAYPYPGSFWPRAAILLVLWLLIGALGKFGKGWQSGPEPPLSLDFALAKRLTEYRKQLQQLRSTLAYLPFLLFIIARPFSLARVSTGALATFGVALAVFVAWTRLRRNQLQREIDYL